MNFCRSSLNTDQKNISVYPNIVLTNQQSALFECEFHVGTLFELFTWRRLTIYMFFGSNNADS